MAERFWTCQRVANGVRCGYMNAARRRKCQQCGKPRPDRKRPAHMRALDIPYEEYVRINGGEFCGICGAKPSATRRLDRDHDHVRGVPRGVLCWRHNKFLMQRDVTSEFLRRVADYLDRTR